MKKHRVLPSASMALMALALFSCSKTSLQEDLSPSGKTVSSASTASVAAAVSMQGWMTSLPDNTSLSQLSIPGTHDSGARIEPIGGTAKTQDLSIADQLNAGIRFLDIRCRHIGDAFAIHHGSIYQQLNFTDVLNACNTFLNNNPGECIIMCVKEEHTPTDNTRSFEATFDSYTQQNPGRWLLSATVPTLGSARGKIVLLRRFGAGNTPKGIDATNWADNTTFTISNGQAELQVQDYYKVTDNNTKWNAITSLLTAARSGNSQTLYINFSSGYKPLIFGIPSITTVSDFINPKLGTYFTDATKGRFGIIPMDFANSDRTSRIVQTNFQ